MAKEFTSYKYITSLLLAVLVLGLTAGIGVGLFSSGTVGNVTANLTNNTGNAGSSVDMNFTVNDTVNATSWYNITFPSGFNAAGALVNITINGSADPVNWTKIPSTLYVNVSSDGTVFADSSFLQYINISNITLPSVAQNYTINVTTNNSIIVPLNYTVTSPATVNLGTAGNFAILAGTGITRGPGSKFITGNVGSSPTAANTIICADLLTGTKYTVDAADLPCEIEDAPLLTTAKNDLTAAYNDAAGRTSIIIDADLTAKTLTPGVYRVGALTPNLAAGGTLTLDGQGDPVQSSSSRHPPRLSQMRGVTWFS